MSTPDPRQNPAPPVPPEELKPWYYQNWFLYPAFILWPLWAFLMIRSPWHNGLLSGGVAWAMLMAGTYLVVLRLREGGTVTYSTITLIVPGLVLTLVIQVLWTRYRATVISPWRRQSRSQDMPASPGAPPSRRARNRRSGPGRHGGGRGRTKSGGR